MISCKVRLHGKTIQLGNFNSLKEAVASCFVGFHSKLSTFQSQDSITQATFFGKAGSSSLIREFERAIESDTHHPSDSINIEMKAQNFIEQKFGHVANPVLKRAWTEALVEGIEPHEIELSVEGSFRKEELEKNINSSYHSC